MSVKCIEAVWTHSEAEKTGLLVLLSLADRADLDGFCWPSLSDTARRARTSRQYASELIRELTESGELFVRSRPGTSNQYIVAAGMPTEDLFDALQRRFNVSKEQANMLIRHWKEGGGVRIPDTLEELEGVRISDTTPPEDLTGGVDSAGAEPSVNRELTVKERGDCFFCHSKDVEMGSVRILFDGSGRDRCETCEILGVTWPKPLPVKYDHSDKERLKRVIDQSLVAPARMVNPRGFAVPDYSDYPEELRDVLQAVSYYFEITPTKKQKGYWITGARNLKEKCGEFGVAAIVQYRAQYLSRVVKSDDLEAPHTIKSPDSLTSGVGTVAAALRDRGYTYEDREKLIQEASNRIAELLEKGNDDRTPEGI